MPPRSQRAATWAKKYESYLSLSKAVTARPLMVQAIQNAHKSTLAMKGSWSDENGAGVEGGKLLFMSTVTIVFADQIWFSRQTFVENETRESACSFKTPSQ